MKFYCPLCGKEAEATSIGSVIDPAEERHRYECCEQVFYVRYYFGELAGIISFEKEKLGTSSKQEAYAAKS